MVTTAKSFMMGFVSACNRFLIGVSRKIYYDARIILLIVPTYCIRLFCEKNEFVSFKLSRKFTPGVPHGGLVYLAQCLNNYGPLQVRQSGSDHPHDLRLDHIRLYLCLRAALPGSLRLQFEGRRWVDILFPRAGWDHPPGIDHRPGWAGHAVKSVATPSKR